ncbi:hypothetical protein MAR_012664 [Mya arenaria]|uniref:Uncharacterized protein n=1 Tax=Mya arenaria TaxID=6604 RepID=A0ABY7FXR3_MYAAR|nr:hypothetical protein MAR_012664 [Mya arenaria]
MAIEDFPSPIQEFVVNDVNEGRKNNIRISQNIIAQEILEQILSFFTKGNLEETRTHTLTLTARKSLSKFCIHFIEYTSQKKTKTALSTTVMFILTKTFIFRDERDMGDNEEQVRRKPVLSNVMIDIPAGKPLFTERLNVLKKLVDSFPDDPNFHAHLGRFFAFCRQDEEHEAEKCFQTAVKLCDDLVSGRTHDKIDDGMKLTMMHIFHMYGIVKQRYVAKYTGRAHKEKVVAFSEETIFIERLEEILPSAEEACEFFTKSRSITPESHDVYVYAYTGEIQVRLQICDFINNFQQGLGLVEFLNTTTNQRAKQFVQKSIPLIETLVIECYMEVDLLNADLESLRKNVVWYNMLFKRQALPLEMFASEDGVNDRRLKIASKKLKHCKTSTGILKGIDDVDDENDIEDIITLYEEIFSEIDNRGHRVEGDKKLLEREFREWIYAIRHEKFRKNYTLEEVLTQLTVWYENVRSPLSVFYMFILYSLLGFGTSSTPGKTECLLEALDHLVIRPKYPREWLGTSGEGIKRLKPSDRYVGISEDGGSSQCGRLSLAVCKGTICRPNTNSVNGMLALDLGVKTSDVKVYFIPKMVKLEGSRYAGERVEFNLAFTIKHGYGAFNVKLLKRHSCSNCSLNIEFTSVENTITCKCGSDVHKDEMNEYTG